MSFSYTKSNIITTKAWKKPSKVKLQQIYNSNLSFFNTYDCYVFGNFVDGKPDTWDIDLLVSSDLTPTIGDDCVALCNYAHDQLQLIDIMIMRPSECTKWIDSVNLFNAGGEFARLIERFKPHGGTYIKNGVTYTQQPYTFVQSNVWEPDENIVPASGIPAKFEHPRYIPVPVRIETFLL
jgi:hypothetical protein